MSSLFHINELCTFQGWCGYSSYSFASQPNCQNPRKLCPSSCVNPTHQLFSGCGHAGEFRFLDVLSAATVYHSGRVALGTPQGQIYLPPGPLHTKLNQPWPRRNHEGHLAHPPASQELSNPFLLQTSHFMKTDHPPSIGTPYKGAYHL